MAEGGVSGNTGSFQVLAATPEAVYITSIDRSQPPSASRQVIALDAKTGAKLWATEQLGPVHSLAIGPTSLYVAGQVSGIRAYDTTNGKLRWISNQPPPDHEGYELFFREPQVQLFIVRSQRLFATIDPKTGVVSEYQRFDNMVAIDSQFRYMSSRSEFWTEEIVTGKVRWTIPISINGPSWPIISGDLVVISTPTSNTSWRSVIVVNRNSGQKAWECFDCFASDVAVDKDRLYAIIRDGSLAAYDIMTGELTGSIKFAGGDEIDPSTELYALRAANGTVFLYFGDNHELIALGP